MFLTSSSGPCRRGRITFDWQRPKKTKQLVKHPELLGRMGSITHRTQVFTTFNKSIHLESKHLILSHRDWRFVREDSHSQPKIYLFTEAGDSIFFFFKDLCRLLDSSDNKKTIEWHLNASSISLQCWRFIHVGLRQAAPPSVTVYLLPALKTFYEPLQRSFPRLMCFRAQYSPSYNIQCVQNHK